MLAFLWILEGLHVNPSGKAIKPWGHKASVNSLGVPQIVCGAFGVKDSASTKMVHKVFAPSWLQVCSQLAQVTSKISSKSLHAALLEGPGRVLGGTWSQEAPLKAPEVPKWPSGDSRINEKSIQLSSDMLTSMQCAGMTNNVLTTCIQADHCAHVLTAVLQVGALHSMHWCSISKSELAADPCCWALACFRTEIWGL